MVQYCESRVQLASELQSKLAEIGYNVGQRVVEVMLIREKNFRREIRLISMLIFIRNKVWLHLFGKEADKLEQANDDKNTCRLHFDFSYRICFKDFFFNLCFIDYIIEHEPIVNKFISVPKDKKFINCAAFIGGIIEAILNECNFVSYCLYLTINLHSKFPL